MFVELTADWQGCKAGERIDVSDPVARRLVAAGQAKTVLSNPIASALDRATQSAVKRFEEAVGAKLEELVEELHPSEPKHAAASSSIPKESFMAPTALTQERLRKIEYERWGRERAYYVARWPVSTP